MFHWFKSQLFATCLLVNRMNSYGMLSKLEHIYRVLSFQLHIGSIGNTYSTPIYFTEAWLKYKISAWFVILFLSVTKMVKLEISFLTSSWQERIFYVNHLNNQIYLLFNQSAIPFQWLYPGKNFVDYFRQNVFSSHIQYVHPVDSQQKR